MFMMFLFDLGVYHLACYHLVVLYRCLFVYIDVSNNAI